MTWLYLILIILVIILIYFLINKKGKNPNNDARWSKEDKQALEEDYLSHGKKDNQDDRENI